MITASGEVHTNEEAQENVHDLNPFVTVQILEDTPAVLPLGKLCEDHGYSCERTSGQKPTPYFKTAENKCNTENNVPILVPGLSSGSSNSITRTFPTSLPQKLTVEDSAPSPATIRRRSAPSRILGNQLHDSTQTEDETEDIDFVLRNRLQDLPEWLEDFTESLLDDGVSG